MTSPAYENPLQAEIAALLRRSKRIAVVGMSANPERASHHIGKFLIERGYEVIPVNPVEREILGRKSFASLSEVEGRIDIVDVFRRSDQTDPVIDAAIAAGVGAIWLQEQVINDAGALRAAAAGVLVVQDRCILKELKRL
jgi:hypothetical protein